LNTEGFIPSSSVPSDLYSSSNPIDKAIELKEKGNEHFKDKEYNKAMEMY